MAVSWALHRHCKQAAVSIFFFDATSSFKAAAMVEQNTEPISFFASSDVTEWSWPEWTVIGVGVLLLIGLIMGIVYAARPKPVNAATSYKVPASLEQKIEEWNRLKVTPDDIRSVEKALNQRNPERTRKPTPGYDAIPSFSDEQ